MAASPRTPNESFDDVDLWINEEAPDLSVDHEEEVFKNLTPKPRGRYGIILQNLGVQKR